MLWQRAKLPKSVGWTLFSWRSHFPWKGCVKLLRLGSPQNKSPEPGVRDCSLCLIFLLLQISLKNIDWSMIDWLIIRNCLGQLKSPRACRMKAGHPRKLEALFSLSLKVWELSAPRTERDQSPGSALREKGPRSPFLWALRGLDAKPPPDIGEGNLLYGESTYSHADFTWKHPQRHTQRVFSRISGHLWSKQADR